MDQATEKPSRSTFSRVFKFLGVRAVVLALMVAIGIFLAIVIINYGGYIDNIHRADIDEALSTLSLSMRGASPEEVAQATADARWAMEEAFGMHKPFLLRCVNWWYQTLTLNWGTSYRFNAGLYSSSGPVPVTAIVLYRVPYTLMLAGATYLILFFASIFVALKLSKNSGGFFDRMVISLSPLSAIPNWVYGIILTVIFAGQLHLLPFNGLYDTFPPATKLGYIPIVLKHMILPVTAIILGMFFSTVYTWRTFFLIHSGEDYLEMAKAKGAPDKIIERRYVLKPTLPFVITSFAILMLTFWQGIIVLEVFFDWPGLGQLFMASISAKEMSVTIGIVTVFAFLLGFSVFMLDIIYALVDPRVKIGGNEQTVQPARRRESRWEWISDQALMGYARNFRLRLLSMQQNVQNWPRMRSQTSAQTAPRGTSAAQYSYLTGVGFSTSSAAANYCPYLVVENNLGTPLQVPAGECRCNVHGKHERIATAYQKSVCRTPAYSQCPRLVPETQPRVSSGATGIPSRRTSPSSKGDWLNPTIRELFHYPVAMVGIAIIIVLVGMSIYTVIAIPYKEAIARWQPEAEGKYLIPKNAMPECVNWFRKIPLPPTMVMDSATGTAEKELVPGGKGTLSETITYTVDYPYSGFPQDMLIIFNGQYQKKPFVSLVWTTPDGREFDLGNFSAVSTQRFLLSTDIPQKYLAGQVVQKQGPLLSGSGGPAAVQLLFKDPAQTGQPVPLNGKYTLRIDTALFEPDSNLDAQVILYGQVYGLAGTDDLRRDLLVPLLWGIPVALAFGVLGAVTTGVLSMLIAAVGVWRGGWIDGLIQRITEVNMILPVLPIAITIYYLYSKSIWVILGVIILLSIFGSAIKTYRSAFIQVKESPYIEAAQAYGASNWRIIRSYMVPRIIPLLIPQLVILIPSYVFFEATLAYLHVSDPYLPTWGKVVFDALNRGAFGGYYYWVLEPVAMMIITALAFAVVGFALDSILNPRLRRV